MKISNHIAVKDNNTIELILKNGRYLLNKESLPLLGKHKVYISTQGYVCFREFGKTIRACRLINNTPAGKDTDHINGNTLDDRKCNLRTCSHSQNMRNINKKEKATSIYKGVYWSKQMKKWRANICKDYKQIFIGLFSDEAKAALAYNKKAKELFGEFARLNIIEE